METWTIGSLLETATGYLRGKGSDSPRLDAELLLAHALGIDRIHLYTQYDRPLVSTEVDSYRALIARRAAHEPVAYLLGVAHFRRLELEVTPATLIPRPETEELVGLALETLRLRPPWDALEPGPDPGAGSDRREGVAPRIVDVGTGSGAIALSLAQESGLGVLAVDSSAAALAVAERNRSKAGLDRLVSLRQGDLLSGVADDSMQMVVSNPPYVTSAELLSLAPDVRSFEPRAALDGGVDGLDVYRRLVPEAFRVLGPGGTLLLEVGHRQAEAVRELVRQVGFALAVSHADLSGKQRMVQATMPGTPVKDPDELDETRLRALAAGLAAGAIIGLPTDTVYGLAARWDSQAGVRRLFDAKGRAQARPVAVIFPSVDSIVAALPDLDPTAVRVLRNLLPGPYTFVVSTSVPRPELVGTEDSLGVRVPAHPPLLRLLSRLGVGVAATSANVSGAEDAATLADVDLTLLAHCALALAPGAGTVAAAGGTPSTVVDLRPLAEAGQPQVLREGAVREAEVLARIAALVRDPGPGGKSPI